MRDVAVAAYTISAISALWLAFTPVAIDVQQDLSIGTGRFGMIVSACFLLTAVLFPLVGALADRRDLRHLQMIMLALAVAGTWASAAAPSFASFTITRLVVGASAAAFVVSLRQALRVVSPGRAGLVQGVIGMCFSVGVATAAIVMPWLSVHLGWRTSLAVFALVAVPAFWWQLRLPGGGGQPGPGGIQQTRTATSARSTVALTFANFVVFGGTLTVVSFLPLFFTLELTFTTRWAGLVTAIAVGVSGTGRVLGGWVADHLGGLGTFVACMAAAVLGAAVTHTVPHAAIAVVGAGVLLLAFNAAGGAVFALAARTLRRENLGRALGLIAAGGVAGGLLLATPYGLLVERTGSFVASNGAIVALGFAAAAGIALCVPRHRTVD